jgi:hypothetical protein
MPSWTCTICSQVVELCDDDRPPWAAKAYENCKPQHHYVDNACIGHTHPQVAMELIMMAVSGVGDRPLADRGLESRNHSHTCDSKARNKNLPDGAATACLRRPFPTH